MRTPALLTLMAAWGNIVYSQPTFEKFYDGIPSFKFNLTEMPDQNVLVGLGSTRAISHLDPSGNVVYTHSYWAHPTELLTAPGGIRRYSNNEYVFAAGYKMTLDTCTSANPPNAYFHPVIGKMDVQGNLLDLRHYVLNEGCRNVAGDVVVTTDMGLVTWGYERSFFAMKADSTLAPVWAKHFASNGGFQFIKELPGGDLLAGINMDTAGAVIARLDAAGNFIWCKSYFRPRGVVYDAVIESDSSFVITGYTDSTTALVFIPLPSDFHPKHFMMKLDGSGDVQWCKGYEGDPYLWYTGQWTRIAKAQDGNYVVLATIGTHENGLNYNFFFRPFLMKTDLNGDTLWTRSVGGNDFVHFATDLLAYSDGGYMISGGVWGDLPDGSSAAFIFKTDSLGHFPCVEHGHPVQVTDLFPTDSSFTLTSVDGATMMPAYVNDTVFDPIAVYDACLITTVVPNMSSPTKLSVRPNPTTGRITMAFADPLAAESYYSVYDAMGRLLYQRPLPMGATAEEIDLSRFGKGTYVIKLTDPDGVCFERVVLE